MKVFFRILFFFLLVSTSNVFSQENNSTVISSLSGFVENERTNRAEDDILIKARNLSDGTIYKARTNDDGIFTFKNIPAGKYLLETEKDNFFTKSFEFEVTPTHSPNLNFTVVQEVSWMFNWGDAYGKEHYWSHFTAKVLLILYGAGLVLVFFYSVLQLSLAITYTRNRKTRLALPSPRFNPETAPKVTVQLPMYNELYVAERIIDKVAEFEYPRDKFQIQVLDDSTDETKEVIAAKVAQIAAKGINIVHIHRVNRVGYKAGALDAAMDRVEGDFIAIFDSDFVPLPDFLIKTMPYFQDPKIGVVQTRWGHLNKDYSVLTELQAFGLNGHFAIEQGGRSAAGHFINFNGTGGIWRKKCIEDAGGWEHDTLTEDLDLSYRAQIKGWKFKYLEDVIAPAELPITMSALKNQQHRWMKGGAECFRKMWKRLLTAKGVKAGDRIHGLSHLFNSSVFIFILMISVFSLPILHIKDSFGDLNYVIRFGAIFIISTVFLMFYYWMSYRDKTENTFTSFIRFTGRFFLFLIVSMGLALSNTVAVIEGYLGIKSSFVRTPKFNVSKKGDFKGNKYDKKSLSIVNIGEFILFVLFLFTAINRAIYGDLGMVPFHLMLAAGYGMVFFYTLSEVRTANRG